MSEIDRIDIHRIYKQSILVQATFPAENLLRGTFPVNHALWLPLQQGVGGMFHPYFTSGRDKLCLMRLENTETFHRQLAVPFSRRE
jgi:hypothetical protein